jgi:hypothetical protein
MSVGLQLILSTALVAVPPGCSWAHPGANPYRGDPTHALADFAMPAETREKLRAMMRAHQFTDTAQITRDDIVGARGYADLREMHSGRGQVCHGSVDRSAWTATRKERGLVYCADDVCVIVPTICNNVSLVTRKPEHAAVLDDTPIDIEPAAGPPAAPTQSPADAAGDTLAPGEFVGGPGESVPVEPGGPGGGSGGGSPIGGAGFPGGGTPGGGFPIGGGGPCCGTGPGGPGQPGGDGPGVPPTSPVPEAPTGALLLAGLAVLVATRAWRGQARSRSGCACAGHGDAKNASTIADVTPSRAGGFHFGE